jgi:transposase
LREERKSANWLWALAHTETNQQCGNPDGSHEARVVAKAPKELEPGAFGRSLRRAGEAQLAKRLHLTAADFVSPAFQYSRLEKR